MLVFTSSLLAQTPNIELPPLDISIPAPDYESEEEQRDDELLTLPETPDILPTIDPDFEIPSSEDIDIGEIDVGVPSLEKPSIDIPPVAPSLPSLPTPTDTDTKKTDNVLSDAANDKETSSTEVVVETETPKAVSAIPDLITSPPTNEKARITATESNKEKNKKPAVISNVPPGFESLLEPQTTLVDVYWGGQFIGSQLATYTPDEITFSNPEALLTNIPQLLNPQEISEQLQLPLATHQELICHYTAKSNCGELITDSVGVIFNPDQFRADLFIDSQMLALNTLEVKKFLPASDADWSFLQTLNAAYSGSETFTNRTIQNNTYAISSQSTFSFRENRLHMSGAYSDSEGNTIDTLVARRDWRGLEYQLGYFRSNSGNLQFLNDTSIRGLRFASSLDTREDLRHSTGNELQIFLNTRSEVLLFKDDRLISSRIYDAGNQVLDTSQLPGGAYDVRIEIREAGQAVREETRFYIKSNQLPPIDQPLFFIEAGELLDTNQNNALADSLGISVLRTGYQRRFGRQIGLLAGVSVVDKKAAAELGLTHLGRYHDINLGTFIGNDEQQGISATARVRAGIFYLSASYRKLTNENYDITNFADLLGPSYTQGNLNFSAQFTYGKVDIGSRINKREAEDITTHTLRYEFPRLRFGRSDFYLGLQANRENDIDTFLLTFELRHNSKHVTTQIRPEYSHITAQNESFWQANAIASWRDKNIFENDLRMDIRARKEASTESLGAEMDFASQSGRIRLQAETAEENTVTSTRYNGNAFTSFMINTDSIKLGGKEQSQSALLVNVKGQLDDAVFDVLIDGAPRASIRGNSTTAINLRPFKTYKVRLIQRGASFVDFDQREREITLYPGNVVTLSWEAAELDIVFGQLTDQNDQPIANALIHGVVGIATSDDSGLFQAELARNVGALTVETLNQTCEVSIPPYSVQNTIGNLGKLRCSLQAK